MKIIITRHADREHEVQVERADGSSNSKVLNSRSFLRHDLAHLAVESCLAIEQGYWGLVAAGAALDGDDLKGADLMRAERFAGPVQTLMRLEAGPDRFFEMLQRVEPAMASRELADRLHEKCRQLAGHWRGTPFGGEMVLEWGLPV